MTLLAGLAFDQSVRRHVEASHGRGSNLALRDDGLVAASAIPMFASNWNSICGAHARLRQFAPLVVMGYMLSVQERAGVFDASCRVPSHSGSPACLVDQSKPTSVQAFSSLMWPRPSSG